ncbi:tripartite tricarboxylate transporter substrate-binding protein [uncultured Jannaschia sp.]|uniref:Bug family tripartite tricarboxylate transporter substrate binding protein n=1 Tax=uncultured Jannaschia sp. TaxID=293347 RepID=UPI00261086B4|nr:tripartite tricarboxylate transporter substrate-binding protein [uncultured Jannaschia sp.]
MIRTTRPISRRSLIRAGTAGAAVGLFTPSILRAQAAYPNRNINVVIATGQGGGAETTARAFTNVLREDLGVDFEFEFHPGAGGQVGYELYASRRDHDGYNLLYSNMHPEIITYATQNTNYDLPEDIIHFAKTGGTPIVFYVGADSPIETVEQLIEEGRRRTVTIATSRLPHPGTIGMLSLADAVGADFNLIPFGGGNPTSMAAITGETDAAVLTAGVAISLGDQVRVLGTFRPSPDFDDQMGNPPSVNDVFDTTIPGLELANGWAIHTDVWKNMPEVRERLVTAIRSAFDDPELRAQYEAVNYPFAGVEYGDEAVCAQIREETIELARRYEDRIRES